MKLITGLGNPGSQYSNTRHNAGFLFLDRLREEFLYEKDLAITEWRKEDTFKSEICFLKRGSQILAIFQKPQTFMNRSGEAVAKAVKKFEININNDFILVHDDLDIQLGKFKIQEGKAPVGHNGVMDVQDRLSTVDFKRIRLGIENRVEKNIPGEDYVLMKFTEQEEEYLDEAIYDAVKSILADLLL